MKDFWSLPEVDQYIFQNIYDIDEIVREFAIFPESDNSKVIRNYFKIEWHGTEEREKLLLPVSKEDFEKNRYYPDKQYYTTLNYTEFIDHFWFRDFEFYIREAILENYRSEFFQCAWSFIFETENESRSKGNFANILNTISQFYFTLGCIPIKEKLNYIQEFVLEQVMGIYKITLNDLIQECSLIFPNICQDFKNKCPEFFDSTNERVISKNSISNNKNILETKELKKENPSPEIFRDFKSSNIFNKLFNQYGVSNKNLANYSFIYYAMQADGFIICSNSSFKQYLGGLNIHIDKIDSRKSGYDSKRTPYYCSVRDSIIKAQ